jgi:hypothetical protein
LTRPGPGTTFRASVRTNPEGGAVLDIRRSRLGGAAEWLVAFAFLIATVLVAVLIIREMRAVRTAPTAPAASPSRDEPSPNIPQGAMSVPSLLLPDGRNIRVGDTLAQVNAEVGSSCNAGADVVEEGPLGNRITRPCEHAGTRFVITVAPYERNGPLHVTAIYLR